MEPQYVSGAESLTKGVTADESGIKVSSVVTNFRDEKLYSRDRFGGRDGFAHDFDAERVVTVSGEIAGEILGDVVFGAAATIANMRTGFGITDGDPTLDDATITEDRGEFQSVTMTFTALKGVSVSESS